TRHAAPPGNSPYPKWCLPGRVPLTRPASLSLSPIETLRYPMTGSSTDYGRLAGRSGEAECRIDAGRVVVPAAILAIVIVPFVPFHTLAASHAGVVVAEAASWRRFSRPPGFASERGAPPTGVSGRGRCTPAWGLSGKSKMGPAQMQAGRPDGGIP